MKYFSLFPALVLIPAPVVVQGCGGFFCTPQQPVVQSAETIVFGVEQMEDDDTTVAVTMSVQIEYEGPTERFSWILPLPAVPNVTVGTDALFARLMERTNPTFELDIQDVADDFFSNSFEQQGGCPFPDCIQASASFGFGEEDDAVVLDAGSVGPFDFVIIEAPDGDNDAAYRWLNENGFDQPEMSGPLLNYYAEMGMKFLALKLSKNNDAGDIQPIVLKYNLNGDVLNDALACVPIKLTAVAAASALPVQVFLLGPHRAVPVNYLEAEMDLELVDWLGCTAESCFVNDHRARANAIFSQVGGKAFTTEYSGETSGFANFVALDIDLEAYKMLESPAEYLAALQDDSVPYTNQVHGIVSEYIESVSRPQPGAFCSFGTQSFTFPPFGTQVCLGDGVDFPPIALPVDVDGGNETSVTMESVFDAVGLTDELNGKVYQLLEQDEAWLLSHAKLTRMYGNFAGPDDMTKDPFFAFRADLPDVSNVHRATAVPVCEGSKTSLDFSIDGAGGAEMLSFTTEAIQFCGRWIRQNSNIPLFNETVTTARALVAHGFGQEESSRFVQMTEGVLNLNDLGEIEAMLDLRVPNQTLPEWQGTASSVGQGLPPVESSPTSAPSLSLDDASRAYTHFASAVFAVMSTVMVAATLLV